MLSRVQPKSKFVCPTATSSNRVELLGSDERRDVAALKISAGALPAIPVGSSSGLAQGDAVYAVTNAGGLAWSATEGIPLRRSPRR